MDLDRRDFLRLLLSSSVIIPSLTDLLVQIQGQAKYYSYFDGEKVVVESVEVLLQRFIPLIKEMHFHASTGQDCCDLPSAFLEGVCQIFKLESFQFSQPNPPIYWQGEAFQDLGDGLLPHQILKVVEDFLGLCEEEILQLTNKTKTEVDGVLQQVLLLEEKDHHELISIGKLHPRLGQNQRLED